MLSSVLFSCGGVYKVTAPMSHMPTKWRPYFQEMATITYKEYRLEHDQKTAIRLTNQKIGLIMLNMPERQLKKMEEHRFNCND